MNISLLEPIGLTSEEIDKLAAEIRDGGHNFTYYDNKTTDPEELARRSAGQDVVMIANNPYPASVIESADSLKMIAVAFTGIDHVDVEACKKKGVMICNCAGYSNVSVAELTIGLTIGVYRKITECDRAVRDGGTSAGLMGMEICGKTVGIVGCGQIGRQTAKLFRAFGAKVLAYSRHIDPAWETEGIEYCELSEMLPMCDIVSIHMPLNGETRGFFDKAKIDSMKEGSILINCARGPIIDNVALAEALKAGRIAGAGIDVFDVEPPLPSDDPLVGIDRAVLTPHVAFLTKESMVRRADIEFDNVISWLNGNPKNVQVG